MIASLLILLLCSLLCASQVCEEKGNCPYPNNANAARYIQTPQIPANRCPKCTAEQIIPILLDQLMTRLSAQNWNQIFGMMAEDALYTATLPTEESECCKETVGCLPELFTQLAPGRFETRVLSTTFNPKDSSVQLDIILSLIEDGKIARIFKGKMLWTAEIFCEYKLAYLNLVDFACSQDDPRDVCQQAWPF